MNNSVAQGNKMPNNFGMKYTGNKLPIYIDELEQHIYKILNNYDNKEDCFEVKNINNREGENVEIYELKNGKEEARKIVDLIKREINNGIEEEEICVMCRTHQQSKVIKNLLEFNRINFSSVKKDSLTKSKEVKAVIDYLIILEKLKNKKNGGEHAWWDLIYHLNFSEEDLIVIGKFIKEHRKSIGLEFGKAAIALSPDDVLYTNVDETLGNIMKYVDALGFKLFDVAKNCIKKNGVSLDVNIYKLDLRESL